MFGSCFQKIIHTNFWLAISCAIRPTIRSCDKLRKPFLRHRENSEQISEKPKKFFEKIFFAKYLTFFQISCIIDIEREEMREMETRTYYFPCNRIGRHILNYLIERVGCSVGEIRKVSDTIAVPITVAKRDVVKVERILQMYDLM